MSKTFVLYSRNRNDFNLRKRAASDDAIIIGGYSSTIGNARDLLGQSNANSMIITNQYHIPRVKIILDYYKVAGKVVSAEEILGCKNRLSITEPIKISLTIMFIKFQELCQFHLHQRILIIKKRLSKKI